MARRAPVATQRHALGVLALALVPERPTEAGIGAVSHHHVTGGHLTGMAVLRLGRNSGTAQRRPFHYGLNCLGVLPEGSPALGSVAGNEPVEVLAGHHVAVGRQALYLRPRHYEAAPEAVGAQALIAMAGGQLGPRPMSWSWRTERGVRPSPHVFSLGKAFRSNSTTSWPALASQ